MLGPKDMWFGWWLDDKSWLKTKLLTTCINESWDETQRGHVPLRLWLPTSWKRISKISTGNTVQQKSNIYNMTKTYLMCLHCVFLKRKFLRILTSKNILISFNFYNQRLNTWEWRLGTCKVCHRFVAAIGVTCRNQALAPLRSVTPTPVLRRLIRRQSA